MKVGLVGCGNISETYFNCQKFFNNFEITTCADIDQEAADKSAKEYNVKVQTVDELMANKEIDLILNLTPPSFHKDIIVKSLMSEKHCFSEKPLAMNFEEASKAWMFTWMVRSFHSLGFLFYVTNFIVKEKKKLPLLLFYLLVDW